MFNPVAIEAIAAVAVSALSSTIAAPLISRLKRFVEKGVRTVELKAQSGKTVRLEIDKRLSQDKVSELVAAAVKSVNAGDEAGVQKVVSDSHIASEAARETVTTK
jgi:hypothetical protein